MLFGTTFSHRQASLLQLDPISTFKQVLSMKFDVIRLGCYWDEIEQTEGVYNFSLIRTYLDLCEQNQQPVLLTVGMKAPRWPEFFLPPWLAETAIEQLAPRVYRYLEETVTTLKAYTCIHQWQVENEPLDPSGPKNLAIPLPVLQEEVALVKRTDPKRQILINFWGNAVLARNCVPQTLPFADIIGLDLYYKQFLTKRFSLSLYAGPRHSEQAMVRQITDWQKPLWITELQAEPWEASHADFLGENPKSMHPSRLQKNILLAKQLHPEAILLWGCEYWFWKEQQGDSGMIDTVRKLR